MRAQGYAIDDEESQPNHICVGAPIYDYRGEIIAAVSASGNKSVVMRQGLPQVIDAVKKAAAGISKRMGHFE